MKKLLFFLVLGFCYMQAQAQDDHMHASKHSMHHRHYSPHHRSSRMSHRNMDEHHVMGHSSHDNMNAPYQGKNSRQNDGAHRNDQRNMNTNNGQPLPPNNGNNGR